VEGNLDPNTALAKLQGQFTYFINKSKLAAVPNTNPLAFKNTRQFLLINAGIALAIQFSFCSACFFDAEKFVGSLDDLAYSFLISCLLSGGISFIISKSDIYFPWLDNPVKRLFFDIFAVTAYAFVVSFVLATIFSLFIWDYFTFDKVTWGDIANATRTPIYISLGITLFFTSRSFLLELRQAAIEAEQMRNERLIGQYQSLKDQLNPHFLFNSLNVLGNLVYEDADLANRFIEKLSRVYRYVLDVQYEELVPLKDEIDFARNYLELQELRFGKKLRHTISVNDDGEFALPPLSLQLLLENAVKHNAATSDKPLEIWVEKTGALLTVKNTLAERKSESTREGIGLKNIQERYRFLSDKEIEIERGEDYFTVILPLIPKRQM
jgi:sensor histidine kinase YesM